MRKSNFAVTTTKTNLMKNVYNPTFYRVDVSSDKSSFDNLCKEEGVTKYDTIESQLMELMLCRNPAMDEKQIKANKLIENHLINQGRTIENYGVWVYYPWKNQAVHILDEEEFIEVRTNRNKLKITQEEQELLRTKKIGIIGLSVGRAIATTIALERIAGEIRLADFDDIELSNLNRIKTPLTELGQNKTISAAREIAEVDPFIKTECWIGGLTEENIEDFITQSGNLDVVIEECDDLKIKVLSRLNCKEFGVPLIMETNDGCIIDIERYDLDKDLEIFNGKLSGKDIADAMNASDIKQKTKVLAKLLDFEKITTRMKESIPEFGKTIRSWPQLGSEVVYGAGLTASIARMLLLDEIELVERSSFDIKAQMTKLNVSA